MIQIAKLVISQVRLTVTSPSRSVVITTWKGSKTSWMPLTWMTSNNNKKSTNQQRINIIKAESCFELFNPRKIQMYKLNSWQKNRDHSWKLRGWQRRHFKWILDVSWAIKMFLERCSFFLLSLTVDYYRETGKMFQSLKENSHAKRNTSRNVCH